MQKCRQPWAHVPSRSMTATLAGAILGLILGLTMGGSVVSAQTPEQVAEGRAAWEKIVPVLQHPRCLNCHQKDRPLQGDASRIHIPAVQRGTMNQGRGTMKCLNCHNERGNNEMAGIPGALHWQLPKKWMAWDGLSSREICLALISNKDGRFPLKKIPEHVREDKLVLWAWEPGSGRDRIPMEISEFHRLIDQWADGNGACPE